MGLDLERYLLKLADAASAPWDAQREASLVDRLVMTWDHVRALRRAGMDVGSHTRSHRVLQTLAPSELEGELAGSRACLEAVLGESIRAIAYPVSFHRKGAVDRGVVPVGGVRAGLQLRLGAPAARHAHCPRCGAPARPASRERCPLPGAAGQPVARKAARGRRHPV